MPNHSANTASGIDAASKASQPGQEEGRYGQRSNSSIAAAIPAIASYLGVKRSGDLRTIYSRRTVIVLLSKQISLLALGASCRLHYPLVLVILTEAPMPKSSHVDSLHSVSAPACDRDDSTDHLHGTGELEVDLFTEIDWEEIDPPEGSPDAKEIPHEDAKAEICEYLGIPAGSL